LPGRGALVAVLIQVGITTLPDWALRGGEKKCIANGIKKSAAAANGARRRSNAE